MNALERWVERNLAVGRAIHFRVMDLVRWRGWYWVSLSEGGLRQPVCISMDLSDEARNEVLGSIAERMQKDRDKELALPACRLTGAGRKDAELVSETA